jgi:hypothetical protein
VAFWGIRLAIGLAFLRKWWVFLSYSGIFFAWSGLNLALIMMIYRPYYYCIAALNVIVLSSLRAKALRTSFARSLSLTIGWPASFASSLLCHRTSYSVFCIRCAHTVIVFAALILYWSHCRAHIIVHPLCHYSFHSCSILSALVFSYSLRS